MQLTLFNTSYVSDIGQQLKESGMALAAANRPGALSTAQRIAIEIAESRPDRTCHMDLVRERFPDDLGPAAGSVFRGSKWVFTGNRIRSTLPANHARELKVWRLK